MTDLPAAARSGRAPGRAEPRLIARRDLMAALNRAAQKRVTIISAPAGSGKTSLLRAWADQPGQDCRVAFITVRPGQQDMQLFWLMVLGAIRAAAGTGDGGSQLPPVTPGSSGSAMVGKVLSELEESCDQVVLIIDDLHELSSPEAAGQVTTLLTGLPPGAHAIVATRRDLPLHLHKLRLAGHLAEIRGAQLRFTEDDTRRLLAAAGIALPEHMAAVLHQRTEGWAAGLRLAVLSLAGHPDPERFVAEFSGSDRTVAEYLMAEMLERQSPEVQGLLLRTSLLDRVNGELADLLTGAPGRSGSCLTSRTRTHSSCPSTPAVPGFDTTGCSAGYSGWNCAAECRRTSPACMNSLRAGSPSMARRPMPSATCRPRASGMRPPACSPTTPSA